jgi:hypothetical protein
MAIHKSFQQILREKMTKNGGFSEENWPNFTLKMPMEKPIGPKAQPLPLEDLLLGKIDISNRPSHFYSRETWFSLYKKEYDKFLTEEIPSEIRETPAEKRPEKRLWSESQIKALKVLIDFGAEELGDFSSDTDIKKAFRRLAKRFHPDTLSNQPESIVKEKSAQFILIHESYKELIGSCGT